MITVEYVLLAASALILVSIIVARFVDSLGVPLLLLFLAVGMLAGSEGPGGMSFTDPGLATSLGVVALMVILFAGGLDTHWPSVRPVLREGISLASLGVLLTALAVGLFASFVTPLSMAEGLLLGAIISSTDAAAVFATLRSRNVSLRGTLTPLLELESGSNDPMAVFLTLGFIGVLQPAGASSASLILDFLLQMGLGAAAGVALGRGMVALINRLRFNQEGFYSVFVLAGVGFGFSLTALLGGSGFLAVYIAGMIIGNSDVLQRRGLLRFFDGLAWLAQITMFLALGLLAVPSRILPLLGTGLLLAGFLMIVARPLSVFGALAVSSRNWREKGFVSWVGLRGAVPIILATFPLMAGLPHADYLFDMVFFIVFTSALLQGWSVPLAAKAFAVEGPQEGRARQALEFAGRQPKNSELVDFLVPYQSGIAGKSIVDLGLPEESLIVLITRNEDFIVPSGGTTLEGGDVVLVLVTTQTLPEVRRIFARHQE